MKKTILYTIVLAFAFIPVSTIAQKKLALQKADKLYENLSYSKAVDIYQKILKKDSSNVYVLQRLADSYYEMSDYMNAFPFYKMLSKTEQDNPVNYYRYAHLLIVKGNFDEAETWLVKYLEIKPDDRRAQIQLEKIDQISQLRSKAATYSVSIVEGNTRFIDMSPVFFHDQLVFASSRDSNSVSSSKHEWNNQPFLDLYVTNDGGDLNKAKKLGKELNTRYHEGPVCFSKDFQKAFFTRNNFYQGKVSTTPEGVNNLKLYIAEWDGKEWGDVEEFPYNSDNYSVGHAALSVDEQTLYFASDMPGTIGETDIYKSTLVDGQWSKPENLGSTINTEGKEMFPYIDDEGVLYFSSDGQAGIGGLDIYAAMKNDEGEFITINLGTPVNSELDDFGYILDTESATGYLTSNRKGGVGDDDIYRFRIIGAELNVITISENTGTILPESTVVLRSSEGELIKSKITNKEAKTNFIVKPGASYEIVADKDGYTASSKSVKMGAGALNTIKNEILYLKQDQLMLTIHVIDKDTKEHIPESNVDISINDIKDESIKVPTGIHHLEILKDQEYKLFATAKGYFGNSVSFSSFGLEYGEYEMTIELDKMEVGKTFVLEDIYYDLDKSDIRPDAAIELDKVVKVLKENPDVKVELSSHTDCRASHVYNNRLSQRRAVSAVKYLVDHGIERSRLVAKGYGETRLVNRCADGVKCSEEEHQMNRRTELKILEDNSPSKDNGILINEDLEQAAKNAKKLSSGANSATATNAAFSSDPKNISELSHFLIAGSFKNKTNAQNLFSKLSDEGYKPILLPFNGKMHTVAVGGFKSRLQAEAARKKYLEKKPGSGVWIMKK